MWVSQIGVSLATAVGVGLVGRWTVPSSARRIAHAKAEAELLQVLPAGAAKEELAAMLEVDVLTHVKLERNRRFDTLFRLAVATVGVAALAAGGIAASLITALTSDPNPRWAEIVFPLALVASALAYVAEWFVTKKMRAIRAESEDQATEQVAEAGGRAHLDLSARAG